MAKVTYDDTEPIEINTHEDLEAQKVRISRRMNANPEIARLVLVNPVLAFQDVGVRLSPVVQRHIMQTLRFPKRLTERRERLEAELHRELEALDLPGELPLTPQQRAHLLFGVLKIEPLQEDACQPYEIDQKRMRAYARRHPLVRKLADYDRVRQGGLVFYPKEVYKAYKEGRRQHAWLRSFRFKV